MEMKVTWATKLDGSWHSFIALDLSKVRDFGVYIIWISAGGIVYVGQGDVAERLRAHRDDHRFREHDPSKMFVTWASVNPSRRDGIERFLAARLTPIIGEQWPTDPPISVNLPWWAH